MLSPTPNPAPRPVAWVTGAAQGIGAAIAERLAAGGAHRVMLIDRNAATLDTLVGRLRAHGLAVQAVPIDLSDRAALRAALAALSHEAPADVLVNNAGIALVRPALELRDDEWDRTLAVNLTAPMLLTRHCLPTMQARGWGRIVNIASISGLRAGVDRLAYGTSKAALIALTQQFAVECARFGVTVNAVAPGMVASELADRLIDPAQRAAMLARLPSNRAVSIDETVAAVAFLVSPTASGITGQTLAVDGGFTVAGWLQPSAVSDAIIAAAPDPPDPPATKAAPARPEMPRQ